MSRLKDKTAIITGGGTGIGKAIAERLSKEGAQIIIGGVDFIQTSDNQYGKKNINGFTLAKKVAETLKNKGSIAIAIEVDVTKEKQVDNMISKTVSMFGKIDIVVNCAGVITSKYVVDLSEDDWDIVIDVNAKGTFLVNRAAAKQMIKQKYGKIINISSIAGKTGYTRSAHYCASKHAVIGFTKSLALELAKENVTVNTICPGIVDTQMWKMLSNKLANQNETNTNSFKRNLDIMIPQGVPQTTEDIAEAVVFLALSDHVTGQDIIVDGGATI